MYVDAHGIRVRAHHNYILPEPNPWGKRVMGGVSWMIGQERRSGLTGYYFFPFKPEDQKVLLSMQLEFSPIPDAPMVKKCNLVRVYLKRTSYGQWDWVERGAK